MKNTILLDQASDEGNKKQNFLNQHLFIRTNFDGAFPYRYHWETLKKLSEQSHQEMLQEMAKCPDGTEAVREMESLSVITAEGLFLEALLTEATKAVGREISEVELDIFLVVDPSSADLNASFRIELFPREAVGVVSSFFASKLMWEYPFYPEDTTDRGGRLAALVTIDHSDTDEENIRRAVTEFQQARGGWPLTSHDSIRMFLNAASFCFCEKFVPNEKKGIGRFDMGYDSPLGSQEPEKVFLSIR